jgi:uncharacterized membrane protein
MLISSYTVFYIATGEIKQSTISMIVLNVVNTVLYVVHEKVWKKVLNN